MVEELQKGDVVRLPDGRLAVTVTEVTRGRVAVAFADPVGREGVDSAGLVRIEPADHERELIAIMRKVAARGDIRIDMESFDEEGMMGIMLLELINRRRAESFPVQYAHEQLGQAATDRAALLEEVERLTAFRDRVAAAGAAASLCKCAHGDPFVGSADLHDFECLWADAVREERRAPAPHPGEQGQGAQVEWRPVTEASPGHGEWVRGRWTAALVDGPVQRGPRGWQTWDRHGRLVRAASPDLWQPVVAPWRQVPLHR